MFIWETARVHRGVSVVVAAAIVGLSGLVMEHGHRSAGPRATSELARLEPVGLQPDVTRLPEVVVTARRLAVA
jgi:hypothetical protein